MNKNRKGCLARKYIFIQMFSIC